MVAGIAIRRLQTKAARAALTRAGHAAREADIPALTAEVESASRVLTTPAARLIARGEERPLLLEEVEALLASGALVVDACRHVVRDAGTVVSLATRPVLFALARALGEAWPGDVPRSTLVARAFRGKHADELHRARLRVEVGRLRAELRTLADVSATKRGFALAPRRAREVVVLAPPVEEQHAAVLAFLADGESWSSSALAIALGASPRTVQRALESACGSRQGAVVRARARASLDDPARAGIPDNLVTPRSTAERLGSVHADFGSGIPGGNDERSAAEILREYGPFPGVDRVNGVTFDGRHVWFASGDRLNAFDPASGDGALDRRRRARRNGLRR